MSIAVEMHYGELSVHSSLMDGIHNPKYFQASLDQQWYGSQKDAILFQLEDQCYID